MKFICENLGKAKGLRFYFIFSSLISLFFTMGFQWAQRVDKSIRLKELQAT
jgi:hypothetical protein